MRHASPSLTSALRALEVRPVNDSPEKWAQDIEEISEYSQHAMTALTLAPLTLVSDRIVARSAANALLQQLHRFDTQCILDLVRDVRIRASSGSYWQEAWRSLRQTDTQQFGAFGEDSLGLFCMGSLHRNGYVRQACVEALTNYRGRLAMAFLLVRMNDWVRPVRAIARLAVTGRLLEARRGDLPRAEELYENLILTDQLERWNRDDHVPIRNAIQATLSSPAFDVVRERGLRDKHLRLQWRMQKLTLELHREAPFEVLRNAITSAHGIIRLWASREAHARLAGPDLRSLVEIMQKDTLQSVRHEAVFALATKLPPFHVSNLIPFLYDSSPQVRFLAGYYLETNHFDVRQHYLEKLSSANSSELAAIVAGIGEKGKPGDEAAIWPLMTHADPQVRHAVLFTVGKLRRRSDVTWLFNSLHDPDKHVVREAASQIEAHVDSVDIEILDQWIQGETRLSLRRKAVRIGGLMERWNALGFLLRAALIDDRALRCDVERELQRWLQRFVDWYSPPNHERLSQLEKEFALARDLLPEKLRNSISAILVAKKQRSP